MKYDRNQDFSYFMDNYMDIYNTYGSGYVVIKDKKVLGRYESVTEAIKQTIQTEKLGTFIVQECNGDISAFTCNVATLCVV